MRFLASTDRPVDFSRLGARIIFIHGENDPDRKDSVRYYQSHLAQRAPRPEFHVVRGADQGFYRRSWHEAALGILEAWLERGADVNHGWQSPGRPMARGSWPLVVLFLAAFALRAVWPEGMEFKHDEAVGLASGSGFGQRGGDSLAGD